MVKGDMMAKLRGLRSKASTLCVCFSLMFLLPITGQSLEPSTVQFLATDFHPNATTNMPPNVTSQATSYNTSSASQTTAIPPTLEATGSVHTLELHTLEPRSQLTTVVETETKVWPDDVSETSSIGFTRSVKEIYTDFTETLPDEVTQIPTEKVTENLPQEVTKLTEVTQSESEEVTRPTMVTQTVAAFTGYSDTTQEMTLMTEVTQSEPEEVTEPTMVTQTGPEFTGFSDTTQEMTMLTEVTQSQPEEVTGSIVVTQNVTEVTRFSGTTQTRPGNVTDNAAKETTKSSSVTSSPATRPVSTTAFPPAHSTTTPGNETDATTTPSDYNPIGQQSQSTQQEGLNGGEIAAIVICSVFGGIAVIAAIIAFIVHRRRRKRSRYNVGTNYEMV